MKGFSVIIVAAGSSSRMGFDKMFAMLRGKPILWHSLRVFGASKLVNELVVVTRKERFALVSEICEEVANGIRCKVVEGGSDRHWSVWKGLELVTRGEGWYVGVHDGARPLLTKIALEECLAKAVESGAACCAVPIADTVKRVGPEGFVEASVSREGLWAMQTPQIFETARLIRAYENIVLAGQPVTDEVSAVEADGGKVSVYSNQDWNFKMTYPADVERAEMVLRAREEL